MNKHTESRNKEGFDIPVIKTMTNASFAIWLSNRQSRASAWKFAEGSVVGPGWEPPLDTSPHRILHGDYVGFTSWFEGRFGHYMDDHLPTIAYLKSKLPESTKFLLLHTPLSKSVLEFLDPEFADTRVEWVKRREVVKVIGKLTVTIPYKIPMQWGCCRPYEYLREWIHQQHPSVPKNRKVIYYSRNSPSAKHLRKVEVELEQRVIATIRISMRKYGMESDFVVFDGLDENGDLMSTKQQFDLFRSARTIIGAHGAGMLGNLAWVDILPGSCQNRVQVLEFIPGPDSAAVQAQYQSLYYRWRHWPVEFNNILYTKESDSDTTFVDLSDLQDALDGMWGNAIRTSTQ